MKKERNKLMKKETNEEKKLMKKKSLMKNKKFAIYAKKIKNIQLRKKLGIIVIMQGNLEGLHIVVVI